MARIKKVELEEDEKALWDAICWNLHELNKWEYDERISIFEKMGQLAESLIARSAIPAHRIEYLTSPEMFVGGYGKSRKDVFERNGTVGREIFRHPDFMKYLLYFMNGPDLPDDTIAGFCQIIEEDRGTSGEVLDQLMSFVRREVRDKGLDRHKAAEEFFKLSYEIDKPMLAESVRSAAMEAR